MIPVSVIVVTKNEAQHIERCLKNLEEFDEIIVVDSASVDKTPVLAVGAGVHVIAYQWNGQYPKKRGWCLDNIKLRHDWVFFVDADEIVTPELCAEIRHLLRSSPEAAGHFITGRYVVGDYVLRFGQPNKKIAFFHRGRMEFPIVDDLDIPGMGEIEGHYQPVLSAGHELRKIGALKSYLLHDALADERAWAFRHEKYARWEAGMNIKGAWPNDPVPWRQKVKAWLRASPLRPHITFLAIYLGLLGFLDGKEGLKFAIRRFRYYTLIQEKQKMLAIQKQGKRS